MSRKPDRFYQTVDRAIQLTSRIRIELHQVAGLDDSVVEEYTKSVPTYDGHGMLFLNFKNFPMCKPYPLLWAANIAHGGDEHPYIDKDKLAKFIVEKLESYLSERLLDEVQILLFNPVESKLIGSYVVPDLNTSGEIGQPAARPAIQSVQDGAKTSQLKDGIRLSDGSVVYLLSKVQLPVTPFISMYATVEYKVTPSASPIKTQRFMTVWNESHDADYKFIQDHPLDWNELKDKLEEILKMDKPSVAKVTEFRVQVDNSTHNPDLWSKVAGFSDIDAEEKALQSLTWITRDSTMTLKDFRDFYSSNLSGPIIQNDQAQEYFQRLMTDRRFWSTAKLVSARIPDLLDNHIPQGIIINPPDGIVIFHLSDNGEFVQVSCTEGMSNQSFAEALRMVTGRIAVTTSTTFPATQE